MSLPVIITIAVGLAMDAFAVAVVCSISLPGISARQVFRFAFHFGLFQAMMPVLGWLSGRTVRQYIEAWDHWAAFGLLLFIGVKIIYNSLSGDRGKKWQNDPTRGLLLVTLSLATSIDALAVGLSLAMVGVDIWYPALIIGVVTLVITAAGMLLGTRIGRNVSRRIEIVGGLILIGIGFKILFMHIALVF
ncbi:MAG: manganese efflux pump MntP family protein [Gemmatimonadota bacterium]|nr:manganese efflux pump MntP family protein [Gemmatimonadota bacterium]